jgi:hypothetical protein
MNRFAAFALACVIVVAGAWSNPVNAAAAPEKGTVQKSAPAAPPPPQAPTDASGKEAAASDATAPGTATAGSAAANNDGPAPEYRMQDVEIRGELERPDVFYIIPRRKADMDLGTLTKSYDKEIMEPLNAAQFEAQNSSGAERGR